MFPSLCKLQGFSLRYVNIILTWFVFASGMTERVECAQRRQTIHRHMLSKGIANLLIFNWLHICTQVDRVQAWGAAIKIRLQCVKKTRQLTVQTKFHPPEAFNHQRLSRGDKPTCLVNSTNLQLLYLHWVTPVLCIETIPRNIYIFLKKNITNTL
jgi:hypothetical protein